MIKNKKSLAVALVILPPLMVFILPLFVALPISLAVGSRYGSLAASIVVFLGIIGLFTLTPYGFYLMIKKDKPQNTGL